MAVIRLADRDVARGQVCEYGRAREGSVGTWRDRRPHVLADLYVDRVRGQAQLGKDHEYRAGLRCLLDQRERPRRIELRLGNAKVGNRRRYADEVMAVQRRERRTI